VRAAEEWEHSERMKNDPEYRKQKLDEERKKAEDEKALEMTRKESLASLRRSMAQSDSDSDALAPGSVSIGVKATGQIAARVQLLQDRIAAKGYRPSRDTAMLVIRTTERLYEAVRLVAFERMQTLKSTGLPIDAQFDVARADLVLPAAVRNFCQDPTVTTGSALELAASCLKQYARPPP